MDESGRWCLGNIMSWDFGEITDMEFSVCKFLSIFLVGIGGFWKFIGKIIKIHSYRNRHLICCHWSNVKENNKKNEIVSRIENNNYISSRNQTQPESGMNPFSPKTNSFLDRTFYYYIFTFIQEGIRLWREGIHPRFWLGLIPRTNIITIFYSRYNLIFLVVLFHVATMAANQVPVAIRV